MVRIFIIVIFIVGALMMLHMWWRGRGYRAHRRRKRMW
jgi:hypothetical protein